MNTSAEAASPVAAGSPAARRIVLLAPLGAVAAYPFLLKAFHLSVDRPASPLWVGVAAIFLLAALAAPVIGLAWAMRPGGAEAPTGFELRARRLAYFAMAAPPLFVFTGVGRGLVGGPLTDEIVWVGFWLLVLAAALAGPRGEKPPIAAPSTGLRVAHGISAALVLCFVLFHLGNHLAGWLGAEAHTAFMQAGRTVYRIPLVEALLVGLLLFQAVSGIRLAWRRSMAPTDGFGAFQIGSGVYLSAFIVTHLTSALISARWVHGANTDWGWATGAPGGLIHDDWNIRLLPHYLFGVFFILAHLASGLRQVLLAHGVGAGTANRIWFAGLGCSGLVASVIILGLVGARV